MSKPTAWTPKDIAVAAKLLRHHLGTNVTGALGRAKRGYRSAAVREIAKALDCNIMRVENRLRNYGPKFDRANARPAETTVGSFRVPEEVVAERDVRRAAADRRDLTATLLGDPPPGYSARDRRASP